MSTKRTGKQYNIRDYTVIRDNMYKIKMDEYIDDIIHDRLDDIMDDMAKDDEPVMCEKDTMGVIRLTEILKNITLIKKYNFENTYNDERIYLCADYIEQELQKLRYNNNHILETDWK